MYSYLSRAGYAPSSYTSHLEQAVNAAYRAAVLPQQQYVTTATQQNPYTTIYSGHAESKKSCFATAEEQNSVYEPASFIFLNSERPRTPFVAEAASISELIMEAFLKTTGKELPKDITISVASRDILRQIHSQFSNQGIAGLSLNSINREIFVVAGSLDEVMLTVGHELGHVITPSLPSEKAEEAKAFAFEMAWASAIFLHNIAGLRNTINAAALNMKPAQNGLHDLAFAFVKAAAMAGKEALQLHAQLSSQQQEFDTDSSDFTTAAATNPAVYVPLTAHHSKAYGSGGYRNISNVQNVPWLNSFSWADLGTGIYGMYIPLTASIFMNERLLRTDLEQFHKTLGHEYVLHHVMQLPDGYVAKVMEEAIFWVKEEGDKVAKVY